LLLGLQGSHACGLFLHLSSGLSHLSDEAHTLLWFKSSVRGAVTPVPPNAIILRDLVYIASTNSRSSIEWTSVFHLCLLSALRPSGNSLVNRTERNATFNRSSKRPHPCRVAFYYSTQNKNSRPPNLDGKPF
jgi:hypothetical protein